MFIPDSITFIQPSSLLCEGCTIQFVIYQTGKFENCVPEIYKTYRRHQNCAPKISGAQ